MLLLLLLLLFFNKILCGLFLFIFQIKLLGLVQQRLKCEGKNMVHDEVVAEPWSWWSSSTPRRKPARALSWRRGSRGDHVGVAHEPRGRREAMQREGLNLDEIISLSSKCHSLQRSTTCSSTLRKLNDTNQQLLFRP